MPRLTTVRKQALDEMMKEAFFEATMAVLNEHGMEGMTMDRVALAAGVAKGSVYRYFRGKRDLLELVYAKVIDPISQDLEAIVTSDQPAIEKLAKQVRAFLEHIAQHVRVFRLLFEDDTAHGLLRSSERRSHEVVSGQLAKIFRQGMEEGVFRPADPLVLANMYLGLCRGALQGQSELADPDLRENLLRLIIGTLLHGIASNEKEVSFGG